MFGESNDQSGTVGFLVGVIVLVFVGVGLSLMVDKRFKFSSGKLSLEETIAEEKLELETVRRQVDVLREDLHKKVLPVSGQPAELEKAKADTSASAARLDELRERRATVEDEVKASRLSYSEYRGDYRKRVRQAAAGEKLKEIPARGGKVYREVTIRRVTSAGIEIVHSEGISRLRPDDLDDSWHERFQWDAEETEAVLLGEKAIAEQHDRMIAKGLQGSAKKPDPSAKPAKPERPLSPEKQARKEADQKIAELRQEVAEAKARLQRAVMEVSRVRNDAVMNRGRSVPGSLETWQERISRMEAGCEKLRSQYAAARGRLASAAPNDALLHDPAQ